MLHENINFEADDGHHSFTDKSLQTQNSNLSLYIHTGMCEHTEKELP